MSIARKQPPLPEIDHHLHFDDVAAIRRIVHRSGVFNAIEETVAGELAEAVLNGTDTSYRFVFLRDDTGIPVAYTCYGEIPLTDKRYDLYWIVVDPAYQGQGLARLLLEETETCICAEGGKHVYAETSGTAAYEAARKLYLKYGFLEVGRFTDFYRDGDDKVVFCKRLL